MSLEKTIMAEVSGNVSEYVNIINFFMMETQP